jgi:hypothetical protein
MSLHHQEVIGTKAMHLVKGRDSDLEELAPGVMGGTSSGHL